MVTASVSPGSVTGSGTPTVTVTAPGGAGAASYTITVTGTSGAVVRTTTIRATVQPTGPYSYYVTDTLNTGNWTQAGTVTKTATTLTAPDANGGSLISTLAVPDGSNDYEVQATVNVTVSGGTYTLFGRATSDARTGGPGAGTYYAWEMVNPTVTSGFCSTNYVLTKRVGGTVSVLYSYVAGCGGTSRW